MIQFDMGFQFPPEEMKRIVRDIQRGLLSDIRSRLLRAIPYLEKNLPLEIKRRIESSDVIKELTYGQLRYDLGIQPEEATAVASQIPEIISKLVQVRVNIDGDTSISLIVEMVKDGYEDILSIPEASFLQTYTTKTPVQIHWLDWLLTKGDNIIIGDFRVKYTPGNTNSRSGGAIMIQKGSFRVPPQYSGTANDNFITRALEGIEEYIYAELQQFLHF